MVFKIKDDMYMYCDFLTEINSFKTIGLAKKKRF